MYRPKKDPALQPFIHQCQEGLPTMADMNTCLAEAQRTNVRPVEMRFFKPNTDIHMTLGVSYPPEYVFEYVDKSLRNIGVETLDLIQYHTWEDKLDAMSTEFDKSKERVSQLNRAIETNENAMHQIEATS